MQARSTRKGSHKPHSHARGWAEPLLPCLALLLPHPPPLSRPPPPSQAPGSLPALPPTCSPVAPTVLTTTAGAWFFLLALPAGFALILSLHPMATTGPAGTAVALAGGLLVAWAVESLGCLCGGGAAAVRLELLRLAAWQAAAFGLAAAAPAGALPCSWGAALPAWVPRAACELGATCLLSSLLLATQLLAGGIKAAGAGTAAEDGGGVADGAALAGKKMA